MNDFGQRFQADFLGIVPAEARNGNDFVVFIFAWPGRAKAHLQQFCLLFNDGAALLDVVGDHVAAKRNDCGVPYDAVFENGYVRGAAANVHQNNSGLFFFLAQNGLSRSKRLQVDVVHLQIGTFNAARNVADAGNLAHHNVEAGFQAAAVHASGLKNFALAVHAVFLRKHVNDFLAGVHDQLVHVVRQSGQVRFLNDGFAVLAGDVVRVLQAADVLSGNAHHHAVDGQLRIFLRQSGGALNGIDRLHNVGDDAALHPQAGRFAHADDFNFAKFVALANDGHNFGGAYVQSNCDFFHGDQS